MDSVTDSIQYTKEQDSPNSPTNKASPTDKASPTPDDRKEPWREFKTVKDDVSVSKVRDMRLYGNNVNAHS
ncbi:hypothetical protein LT330_001579 [Penicillium expansum]|nr:hypothetical protein N7453_004745 [Penicillium expansum]KAK4864956.1 hypothetical protein LT330_001579 [Penicillium expansum]